MSAVATRREIQLEDLSGLAAAAAVTRLRELELRPAVEPVDAEDPAQHGLVVAQSPQPLTAVRRTHLVTLLVGQCSRPRPVVPAGVSPVADVSKRSPGSHRVFTPIGEPVYEELAITGALEHESRELRRVADTSDLVFGGQAPDAPSPQPRPGLVRVRARWLACVCALIACAVAAGVVLGGQAHQPDRQPARTPLAHAQTISETATTPRPAPGAPAVVRRVWRPRPVAQRAPAVRHGSKAGAGARQVPVRARATRRHPAALRMQAAPGTSAPATPTSAAVPGSVSAPVAGGGVVGTPPAPTGALPGPYPTR